MITSTPPSNRSLKRLISGRAQLVIAAIVASGVLIVATFVVGMERQDAGSRVQDGGQVINSRPPAIESPTPVIDAAATERERSDGFWHQLTQSFEASGPVYASLEDLGARSEAIVLGTFTGEVELGRVIRDSPSDPSAGVFFANIAFRIDEVLAGSLPDQYRDSVKLEYMVLGPEAVPSLAEVVPTERTVLFIASKYLRRAGISSVYYEAGGGKGVFREFDGRVAPVGLSVDPERGRLEGMPFERFQALVREVPVLDLLPEGS